eukprot:6173621-Pleurochrysis_carterae.AAC.1
MRPVRDGSVPGVAEVVPHPPGWTEARCPGRQAGGEVASDCGVVFCECTEDVCATIDLAINRFRSGGYAACDAEDQPLDSRLPPTCCSWEVCEHVNSARQASEG